MVAVGGVFAYGVENHVAISVRTPVCVAYPSSRICALLLEVVDTARRVSERGNDMVLRQGSLS